MEVQVLLSATPRRRKVNGYTGTFYRSAIKSHTLVNSSHALLLHSDAHSESCCTDVRSSNLELSVFVVNAFLYYGLHVRIVQYGEFITGSLSAILTYVNIFLETPVKTDKQKTPNE